MKIFETIAFVLGPILFVIGLASIIIFGFIVHNDGALPVANIAVSIVLLVGGWLLTLYASKRKKRSIISIILEIL